MTASHPVSRAVRWTIRAALILYTRFPMSSRSSEGHLALDWSNAIFGPSGLTIEERRARFWSAPIDYVLLEGPLLTIARRGRLNWLLHDCKLLFENRDAAVLRAPVLQSAPAAPK